MFRCDTVKVDSSATQGSPASQMITAKVMDVIVRPLDCDGQAADAVSANTQVKMEDAPKLLRSPKSECPEVWIRHPRHKVAQIMVKHRRPAGLLWERHF